MRVKKNPDGTYPKPKIDASKVSKHKAAKGRRPMDEKLPEKKPQTKKKQSQGKWDIDRKGDMTTDPEHLARQRDLKAPKKGRPAKQTPTNKNLSGDGKYGGVLMTVLPRKTSLAELRKKAEESNRETKRTKVKKAA